MILMGIFNFGSKKSEENKKTFSGNNEISPIASFQYESTKYALYKINEENPFYFVASNGLILYAFTFIQYTNENNDANKIVFYSRDKYVELKFIFLLSSSNDIRNQETFYISNYKDLVKKFNSYEFIQTFEDDKLANIILSQAPYDVLESVRKISISGFKNNLSNNIKNSNQIEIKANTNLSENIANKIKENPEKLTLNPEEVEQISMTDLSKKVNEKLKTPEMKADPNYQIGYLLDTFHEKIGEEDIVKTKFSINQYTKRPMKVFISNKPKDLKALNQHALVAGVTGSGKTTFINNFTNILLYHGINIISLDIKIGTLDTPVNLIADGQTKKELLDFMNDRNYKSDENIAFTDSDILIESTKTVKDIKTNKHGTNIIPLILYYRPNDQNERDNMKYFSKINILDLPDLKPLKGLKIKLEKWKEAKNKGENVNDDKYKSLDDLQKDYNNKLLAYKNAVRSLIDLYLHTLVELQTSISYSGNVEKSLNIILDKSIDKIIGYIENNNFDFIPSNEEFEKMLFDIDYLSSGDKSPEPGSPTFILWKKLIEAHKASKVVDLLDGVKLYNVLQEINDAKNNFYLILRVTPAFAMFYLLYSYYSVINLLASGNLKSIDENDKESPLVTYIVDEATQLFAVNTDIAENYVRVLEEGQRQTRGIRISWMYGVQQVFKGSFGIQKSLNGRVLFRAQPSDANSMKGLLGSIGNPSLFDAIMKQDLAFISNMPIFIDEYNNVIQDAVIKELPNRAPQIRPGDQINTRNYIEMCSNYLIQNYKTNYYKLNLYDIDIYSYVNKQNTLIKPIDNEIKNILSNIISSFNSNDLLSINNDKNIDTSTLMNLRKMLKFFVAVDQTISYDVNSILAKLDNYSKEKNKDIIVEISKIINKISVRLN